jgi:hypothetical protein
MKLGLLGPAEGDVPSLLRSAEILVDVACVDRAIYLGEDDALQRAVAVWTRRLVGSDTTESGLWTRAADLAVGGAPADIDAFVETERKRRRLRVLESLPGGDARTLEMLSDRVSLLVFDKALLDEEDIYSATFILYGKSEEPVIRRIGARWFVSPGRVGPQGGGLCVLDDGGDEVTITRYDATGKVSHHEALSFSRSTKMRVQGGP